MNGPSRAPGASPLGRAVGSGLSWSALGAGWAKLSSFAAQLVLGYLLSDGDWGVYAIAITLAAPFQAIKDGRAWELILQRGPGGFAAIGAPVFWISAAFNAVLAAILAIGAPLAAGLYGEADVEPMLQLLAAALVIGTPSAVLRAKLAEDLRFDRHAQITMVAAVVRYGSVVALALAGAGPLSFVAPLPAVALIELLLLAAATRVAPWRGAADRARWPALIAELKWLLGGALASILIASGDYLVLGRMVPVEILGVYYFSFELVSQSALLAASAVNTVLLPALARLLDEPDRFREAVLRALRSLMLLVAPISMGLAVVIEPLEALLWGGRWQSAVLPVMALCGALPIRMMFPVLTAALKARAEYRAWALISFGEGVGIMAAGLVAGAWARSPGAIAAVIAIYLALSVPVCVWLTVRRFGVGPVAVVGALAPSWLIAAAVGGVCLAIDRAALGGLGAGARLGILFATYAVIYGAASRVLIASRVADTASVLPGPLETITRALLRV